MTKKDYKTLILSFVLLFFGPGITFFAYSLFLPYLIETYNWGRGVTTVGFAGYWFFLGVGSLLTGSLILPVGIRKVMAIGVAGTGLGFFSLAYATSPWHLVVTYGAVGVGVSLMGIIPVTALLSNQFPSRTGRVLGIAGIGMSAGGLIGSPLIERALTLLGWQAAAILLAVSTWAGGFLILWFAWPQKDLWTGTRKPWLAISRGLTAHMSGIKEYFREARFWWVLLVTLIGSFGQVAILSHMVAHLLDLGIESSKTALALSVTISMGIMGKVLFGYMADRYNASLAMLICFMSQSIGLFFLLVSNGGIFVVFFLLFFGFGMGPFVSLHAQWVLQLYGVEKFQQTYATIRIASMLGAATGPVVAGLIFDMAQSYLWAFFMVILLYFGGAIILTKKISLGFSVASAD